MSDLKIKYVMFDPIAVGWDKGLEGAIRDSKQLGVPLAVKSAQIFSDVLLRRQDLNDKDVIVVIGK